jgi:hypothetical protein
MSVCRVSAWRPAAIDRRLLAGAWRQVVNDRRLAFASRLYGALAASGFRDQPLVVVIGLYRGDDGQ